VSRPVNTVFIVTRVTGQPERIRGTIPAEGETNGKLVWSSRAFEERTEKSTAGSPAVYCRTGGFGKLKLIWTAHFISVGSQAHQPRTESSVGEDPKRIEARSSGENNWLGCCEAHHVGSRTQEDRRRSKSEVGEAEGWEEEGGLEPTVNGDGAAECLIKFPISV
jgi:hypothetical protein